MYRFALTLWPALALISSSAAAEPRQILAWPAVSARQIAFGYAGDLWVVERTGGEPRRLTAGAGLESHPVFSPDGSQVAFAGEYEGNLDVYVVPVAGGQPRRLTYHPDPDLPVGWTPDGKSVLFRSTRASGGRYTRLFTVPVSGGPETEIALPMAEEASFSPDGNKLAYVPFTNTRAFPGGYIAWKRYRGGSAPFIWIADLKTSAIEKLPRTDSNDFNPMWLDYKVYYLSDRDGSTTLYAYDLNTKQVKLVLEPNGMDISRPRRVPMPSPSTGSMGSICMTSRPRRRPGSIFRFTPICLPPGRGVRRSPSTSRTWASRRPAPASSLRRAARS